MNSISIPGKMLDLSKAKGHDHPDIDTTKTYLVRVGGEWFLGKFHRVWYGLSFGPWLNGAGIQFDAPGQNASRWESVIEVDTTTLNQLVEFKL